MVCSLWAKERGGIVSNVTKIYVRPVKISERGSFKCLQVFGREAL